LRICVNLCPRRALSSRSHTRKRELGFRADDILKELNSQQREAVIYGEGPLLIIAGAGTGKTKVITHRIAWLIATKMARPEEILALTFTDKAALEMEERVDILLPYGFSNVFISTFHAFGDRLLREYALELGLSNELKVLSRPEQVIFFRQHLFDFPLNFYRPLGSPTKFVEAMVALFSRAKDEDVTPEEYLDYARNLKEEAERNPQERELSEDAERQEEIASTYRLYQEIMAREGMVDFGDQVVLALKLLRERTEVLREVQERFKFILVDEFQDTNYAQFQLLKLLAGRHENICVVGDDDQSIYKFRGAAISNILGFANSYAGAKKIVLTCNYRSTQTILDFAYRLIQNNNPDRLEVKEGVEKRLEAENNGPGVVTHLHFDTLTTESDRVAELVEEKVKGGGYNYSDFAILVRSNSDADPFLRALNMRGIPYRFSGNRGLYQKEEVRLLISFLHCLSKIQDSLSLFNLASSPIYHMKMGDLVRCMNAARRGNRTLHYVFEHLDQFPLMEELSSESRDIIERITGDINRFLDYSRTNPTGIVLYRFLTETGYLGRLAQSKDPENHLRVQNIAKFFELARRFRETAAEDRVQTFVDHLDSLMEAGDDPAAAEAELDAEAVQVLTIHQAKGLEFKAVIMVGLVQNRFPHSSRKEPLPLPEPLIKEVLPSGDFHLQEERRLFYVGMTRAKKELYLTSARDYGGHRPRKISQFVLEALDKPKADTDYLPTSALEAIRRNAPRPKRIAEPIPPLPQGRLLPLSFYHMDDYLTCPLKYKYIHILKVPLLPHHAVIYGKALHDAVGEYHRQKKRGLPVSLDDLVEVFERAWRSEGFLSPEHEEQSLQAGRGALAGFFEREEREGSIPLLVEEDFSFIFDGNRITGRWDRVDRREEGICIVDFKSSQVRDQERADRRAKESTQLALYALAYQQVHGKMPKKVELHFLESGVVGSHQIGEKDLRRAREMVQEASGGIRRRDFSPQPKYLACRYCPFSGICPHSSMADGI
jgi:DNA helicase-2/ATP-dependent DNA helicase PcrA